MTSPPVPAKNKTAASAIAAALVVAAAFLTIDAAATTIAPAKDRIAEVVIGGKTIIVETMPVFAVTKITTFRDGKTIIAEWAQTIPMVKKSVVIGGETVTMEVQNGRSMAILGNKTITIEIAADSAARIKGLSERQTISGGMLFVYSAPKTICLWMKNTYISLEALFLDAEGGIINAAQMMPHTTNPHCSATAAKYALELPADWRQQNGVMDATEVMLPDFDGGGN